MVPAGLTRTSAVYQHLGECDAAVPTSGMGTSHPQGLAASGHTTATTAAVALSAGAAGIAAASTAGELVRAISASRRSSNFPADLVAERRRANNAHP
jgi:hypothetical protein